MAKINDFLRLMEAELIPNKKGTLKVDLDPYLLYRLLLRMPQPENYIQPNSNALLGLLTFMDPLSYQQAKEKLKKFGIKYYEEDGETTDLWDKEVKHDETFLISPYPGNRAIPNKKKDWDGSKPTAKGSKIKPPKTL